MKRYIYILIGFIVMILLFIYYTFRIPPHAFGLGIMEAHKDRLIAYIMDNSDSSGLPGPPPSRQEIKKLDMRDYWGHELIYTVNKDASMTLISYGKDGQQGGRGKNKDIKKTVEYPIINGTPEVFTIKRIKYLRYEINEYMYNNKTLPSLNYIHKIDVRDFWGRRIIYQTNDDEAVTLLSYGKDGFKGGDKENSDIVEIFNSCVLKEED